MSNSMGTLTSSPPIPKKAVARTALINLDEPSSVILRDCFRQFGIATVPLGGDAAQRLQREKFEACVVRLTNGCANEVLMAARNSPSNRRIVIYGICASLQEALRYSRYGVNALLDDPVDRQAALKVIRSTHLLVLHELRRYVRVPVSAQVSIDLGGRRIAATTQEISAGGMSLRTSAKLSLNQPLEIRFDLGRDSDIRLKASVCWVREADKLVGIRFDMSDERRLAVKKWIDEYLEIG
jgi:hypothetical protein